MQEISERKILTTFSVCRIFT